MPVVGKEMRQCIWCGKTTMHTVKKTVKVVPNYTDYRKETYIFSHEYTCSGCGITKKD